MDFAMIKDLDSSFIGDLDAHLSLLRNLLPIKPPNLLEVFYKGIFHLIFAVKVLRFGIV
jgi:hypothetical protein